MRQYLLLLLLASTFFVSSAQESIIGFTPENVKKQIALEEAFDAKLSTDNLDTRI